MNDTIDRLQAVAYKAERSAARKLAASQGIPEEQALRQTLEAVAGVAGLTALLAGRHERQQVDAARARVKAERKVAADAVRKARHEGPATSWRAWFDGSAYPNPGRCGVGGLLQGPAGERVEISQAAGHGNSSEAEYMALIAVLQAAVRSGSHDLTIYGDSQVVVNDMNGTEHAAAAALGTYRAAAQVLLAQLRGVTLRWIPRHKNTEADALSQRANAAGGADVE